MLDIEWNLMPEHQAASCERARREQVLHCRQSVLRRMHAKGMLDSSRPACHSKNACFQMVKMVELVGIEPTTSSLRTMRSPS